ncbi:MAG: hypothetical protein AAGH82_06745, partial [Pseudomonadota bacterium]
MVMSRYGRWHMPVQVLAAISKAFAALLVFIVAMIVAAYIFLSVRPFDASSFLPGIERSIGQALPDGVAVSINRPLLQMRGPRLAVSSQSIGLTLADGSQARAEGVDFVLSGLSLLGGKISLHEVNVEQIALPVGGSGPPAFVLPSMGEEGYLEALLKPLQQMALQLTNRTRQLDVRAIAIDRITRNGGPVAADLKLTQASGVAQLSAITSLPIGAKSVSVPLAVSVDGNQIKADFELADAADIFPRRANGRPAVVSVAGAMSGSLTLPIDDQSAEGELQLVLPDNLFKVDNDIDKTLVAPALTLKLQPARDRIQIMPSRVQMGTLSAQLLGAVLVGRRSGRVADAGHPLAELIARDAHVRVGQELERLVNVSGRLELGFDPHTSVLDIASLDLRAPSGQVLGSGSVGFTGLSPSIVFNGQFEQLEMDDLLALWPDYVAAGARTWAQANLTGGLATDASIRMAIPNSIVGRLRFGERIQPEHLNVALTMRGTDVAGYQDIPTIRDVT